MAWANYLPALRGSAAGGAGGQGSSGLETQAGDRRKMRVDYENPEPNNRKAQVLETLGLSKRLVIVKQTNISGGYWLMLCKLSRMVNAEVKAGRDLVDVIPC